MLLLSIDQRVDRLEFMEVEEGSGPSAAPPWQRPTSPTSLPCSTSSNPHHHSIIFGHHPIARKVGSVVGARLWVLLAEPGVMVLQGSDAGEHRLPQPASVVPLVPEVLDMLESENRPEVLAVSGITGSRGVAVALALGGSGVVTVT